MILIDPSIAPLAASLPFSWEKDIDHWLHEDAPSFDIGGFIVGNKEQEAKLYIKAPGVIAGAPWVFAIFHKLGCQVDWSPSWPEGTAITSRDLKDHHGKVVVAEVRGPARCLLLGERLALNILARASGIARRARTLKNIAEENGYTGLLAGTRKTTPGFRLVEKYAMRVGGCDPHRYDLSSMVMLKDNHIWSCGGIAQAVRDARAMQGFSGKIEVECRSLDEAREAIDSGADVIMLDNYDGPNFIEQARQLRSEYDGSTSSFLLEASGGITDATVASYMSDVTDIISLGWLSQSVPHVDWSLKIKY
eukprot:TRINITY_DN2961_c0_g1_i2.p1 TRINITY_DN2961_c0_g1~~TRINITY_DN2961_c0_g1_i2.p1  ORF type:complete len:306 (-),score=52.57 TRINITY_DN2961_c0_g1_i2:175-1092(-)